MNFDIIKAKAFLLETIQDFSEATGDDGWFVYKSTLPNGRTKYSKSGQNPTPESFIKKELSVTKSYLTGTSTPHDSEYKKYLADLLDKNNQSIEKTQKLIKVDLIKTFPADKEEEASLFAQELTKKDPNSYPYKLKGRKSEPVKQTDDSKEYSKLNSQLVAIGQRLKNPQGLSKDEIKQLKVRRFDLQKRMDAIKSTFNLPPTR